MLKKPQDMKMNKKISIMILMLLIPFIALAQEAEEEKEVKYDEFGEVIEEEEVYIYNYDPKAIGITVNLSTMTFIGDNPARNAFFETKSDENGEDIDILGGSLQETQSGIDLKFLFPLKNEDLHIPVGFDYIWCKARELDNMEASEYNGKVISQYKSNIFSLYTGIQYDLIEFPEYRIRMHADLLAYATYFHNNDFSKVVKDGATVKKEIPLESKDDTFRAGLGVNLGAEARIYRGLFFNWDLGVSCYNLIGRDDERGQLMTPQKQFENKEDLLFGYQLKVGFLYFISFKKNNIENEI
jgi:hypothetical protein